MIRAVWGAFKEHYVFYAIIGIVNAVWGLMFDQWFNQLFGLIVITLSWFASQHDETLTDWTFGEDHEEIRKPNIR